VSVGREDCQDGVACVEGRRVIGPTGAVRVMVATKPVDFRKGAEGLAALVRETMTADPFSGAVYVFRAKRITPSSIFWLHNVANEMEIEDGVIWVYGVGEDGILAFTDFALRA
jgi:transposase